jgi:signal transduction histidine kinase
MRAPIYKNREFIILTMAVAVVCLLFLGLILLQTHYAWTRLHHELTERNLALLGNLLELYPEELRPEAEAEIVRAFTREAEAAAQEAGQAAAAAYGYSRDLPLSTTPLLQSRYFHSIAATAALGALLLAALLFAIYLASARTYRRLNRYNLGAERIMRGDYDFRFPETGEGELDLLGFQFNQLSRRLQLSFTALQEEKKLLKEMISGISHQLKTPLASSRVFTELLLDEAAADPDVRHEFLQKTLVQLERMEWLIQSLLKISRLETGVIEFQKEYADLGETAAQVVTTLVGSAVQKGHALEFEKDRAPVEAPHDRKWLGEALHNIVDNAIRHTPTPGWITVSLEQTDSTAAITVRDTGPGIPPEELGRIFERFYQGSSGGKKPRRGSGIGLSLAKLIVEKHGGMIQASSAPGEGTAFTITLPRAWLN